MAVKARADITLSSIRDVKAVYRYYKLQASTLTKPSKPTSKPPSGWNDVEPTYTEGSTNSLYTVDLTVFSDDTWIYSEVSLSSSYEAAKTAYNKADNAMTTANGKNKIFFQTTKPSSEGRKVNDIWYDIANGNTMYYWDGNAWTKKIFQSAAIDVDEVFAQDIIASGTITGATLMGAIIKAKKMEVSETYEPYADSASYEFNITRGYRRIYVPHGDDVYMGASDTIRIGAYNPDALQYDDYGSIIGINANGGGLIEFSPDGLYLNGMNFFKGVTYDVVEFNTTYIGVNQVVCTKYGKFANVQGYFNATKASTMLNTTVFRLDKAIKAKIESGKRLWFNSQNHYFFILPSDPTLVYTDKLIAGNHMFNFWYEIDA